jgi:hypothetical protein
MVPTSIRACDVGRALALCQLAYGNESATVEADLLDSYGYLMLADVQASGTSALLLWNPILGELAVAFRGTDDFWDVINDADAWPTTLADHGDMVQVHAGFLRAFEAIWTTLRHEIEKAEAEHHVEYYVFTGHSLGGALAHLLCGHIRRNGVVLITFGMPRVGDRAWVRVVEDRAWRAVRVVHNLDCIPTVPGFPYKHAGKLLHIDGQGRVLQMAGRWWRQLLHHVQGFFRYPKSGITDHFMVGYMKVVKKLDSSWNHS